MPTAAERSHWSAIRAAPNDDAPRLAYADWLQGQGRGPRAEFIRVQCALAKLGDDRRVGKKERRELEPREQMLLAAFGDQWRAPIEKVLRGAFDPDHFKYLRFRRGFIDGWIFSLAAARAVAAAGDRIEPVDRIEFMEAKVNYSHASLAEIAAWPGAGCVTRISLSGAANSDITAIVKSKSLLNLEYLGLWFGKIDDRGVARLAVWPAAARLLRLDLKENPITDVGAAALASSPHLSALIRLDLHSTRITSAGRKVLKKQFGQVVEM